MSSVDRHQSRLCGAAPASATNDRPSGETFFISGNLDLLGGIVTAAVFGDEVPGTVGA